MTSIAIAALAASMACGSDQTAGEPPSPSPIQASSGQSPSPSAKTLSFQLSPVGTAKATGTIAVTPGQNLVTVELKIIGLQPNSSHISHIHIGGCAPSARGAIAFALNQVIADGQGMADIKTTIHNITYPPASGRWYVVVHSGPDMQGTSAAYLMCGNLF